MALLLVLLLAACGAPPGACGIRPHAEVPVRVVNSTPLVEARINGAPVTLLLDTGAERMLLTEVAARRVGLEFDARDIRRASGAGGVVQSFAANVRRFEFAGLSIPDHPVVATPHPLPGPQGERVDGLLPALVLSAFDIDLDLAHGRMTLYGGTVCPDTAIPAWTEPNVPLPAEVTAGGRFNALARLGETRVRALMDTGAQRSIVAPRAAFAAGLDRGLYESAPIAMVRGIGADTVAARIVPLPILEVGPERFTGMRMLAADSGLGTLDMVLGMDYLGTRRLWLSYARQRAFIMEPPRR